MLVGSIGGEGIEGISHRDHARQQRDLLSLKAIRIAAAIEGLVMQFDARQHLRELCDRTQNVRAFGSVSFHDFKFFRGQRPWLLEDAVFDAGVEEVFGRSFRDGETLGLDKCAGVLGNAIESVL